MEKENVGRKKSSKLNNSAALIFHTLEYGLVRIQPSQSINPKGISASLHWDLLSH